MSRTSSRFAILAASLVLLSASDASAILTRVDVEAVADEASARRYEAVCKVLPGGEGALIGPDWILTAAHVATSAPLGDLRVRCAGIEYRISQVIAYPDWKPGESDIALMKLSSPVSGVESLKLHDAPFEVGAHVWLAGRGDFGDAQRGVVAKDGKLRVAENTILELNANRMNIRLDEPDSGALPAEGISGPGDSGTPLLIGHEGRLEVIGIGSVGSPPRGGRYGDYGSIDFFIRISHFREWIDRRGANDP